MPSAVAKVVRQQAPDLVRGLFFVPDDAAGEAGGHSNAPVQIMEPIRY